MIALDDGLELGAVEVLLCDADGNLFPSEEPAFVASTDVTNRLLVDLGIPRSFAPGELQALAVGKNFRAMAQELAAAHGAALPDHELERRVAEEKAAVIAHLAEVLEPDPAVIEPIRRLAERFRLVVVSSSASARLDACFEATGLAELFPPEVRFSAEDSLPVPTSKPDPAIYRFAGERLGVGPRQALAIEDSVTGTRSAVAAGFPTLGCVAFVPEAERAGRIEALRAAGAAGIMSSWSQLAELLVPGSPAPAGP